MKFDLKFIVILILAGIAIFQYATKPKPVQLPPVTVVTVDTIYKNITTYVNVPGKTIYVDRPIYVEIPRIVDTMLILKDYFAKRIYKDTLVLADKAGKVFVLDTISQNRIVNRTYKADIISKTIVIDSTKYITIPPKNQVYAGFNVGFDKTNILTVTGGAVLKTKTDKMYQLGLGITGVGTVLTPYVYAGMFWKIKLKK